MRSFRFLTIALPSLLLLPACRGRGQDLQPDRQYNLTHGISLPIISSVGASDHRKRRRGASTGAIGLGDYIDVYVSVIIPPSGELTCLPPGCTAF